VTTDRRARWPVAPLPGKTREQLVEKVTEVYRLAVNAQSPGVGVTMQKSYLAWANTAIQHLNTLVGPADLERLVLTRRYWTIQEAPLSHPTQDEFHDWVGMNNLVTVELGERIRVLEETLTQLQAIIDRWSRPGVFVVADTSFYIHYPRKLDEVDLADILKAMDQPVHLLMPILVIDELDRLKRSGQGEVRGRAQVTLAIIDNKIRDPAYPAVLEAEDKSELDNRTGGIPRGEVTLEVIFDPLEHDRLPIPDDEIVDRAVAVQALAGRPIRFLTCDTNQSLRARMAGLEALKLPSRT
jgi:PIN domain